MHVAATYDGAALHIYVNGVQDDDAAASCIDEIVANGFDLVIGADSATNYKLTGSIDDVRVYNRARTAAEVSALILAPVKYQTPPSPQYQERSWI